MTENKDVTVFEKKLKQLRKEEAIMMGMLQDIRKQLNRYRIEQLHMSSISVSGEKSTKTADSDSDYDFSNDEELKIMASKLDCAEDINQSTLNLDIPRSIGEAFTDDEEVDNEDSN